MKLESLPLNAGERGQVADQTLSGDLFPEIVRDAGVERAIRPASYIRGR